MPVSIFREEVQRLLEEESAQLVDVLSPREYEEERIAGAISVPLRGLSAETVAVLDRDRPVVVY